METNAFGIQDVLEQVAAKKAGSKGLQAKRVAPIPVEKAIWEDSPCPVSGRVNSAETKQMVYEKITKDLKTTDISSLRLISLADKVAELRNEQTVFLDILRTNPVVRVTDFQVRFRERRIGNQTAQWFNMNVDAFAPEAQSDYPQRTNTLGFLGNKLNIRIIGEQMAQQSPVQPMDIIQAEIEFEMTRIKRAMNSYLLSNQEVTAEVAGTPPQPGGFVTRSTLYTNNLATQSDFTNAIIQNAVNSIANNSSPQGLGYNIELVCLVPNSGAQIAKIRDLMIARYPGTNATTYLNEQSMLRQRFSEVGIAPNQMKSYQPDPGLPVLFILDSQMPANTAIFFDPNQPQLGQFAINGTYGPWALERPTEALTTLLYVFQGLSLIDNLVESRSVVSNLY